MRGDEGPARGLRMCAIYVSVTLMSSISEPCIDLQGSIQHGLHSCVDRSGSLSFPGMQFHKDMTQLLLGGHVSTRVPDTRYALAHMITSPVHSAPVTSYTGPLFSTTSTVIILHKIPLTATVERVKGWQSGMRSTVDSINPLCTSGVRVLIFNTLGTWHFSQILFFAIPQKTMKCPVLVPFIHATSFWHGTPKLSAGDHTSPLPMYRTPQLSKYKLNFMFFEEFELLELCKSSGPQKSKSRDNCLRRCYMP